MALRRTPACGNAFTNFINVQPIGAAPIRDTAAELRGRARKCFVSRPLVRSVHLVRPKTRLFLCNLGFPWERIGACCVATTGKLRLPVADHRPMGGFGAGKSSNVNVPWRVSHKLGPKSGGRLISGPQDERTFGKGIFPSSELIHTQGGLYARDGHHDD